MKTDKFWIFIFTFVILLCISVMLLVRFGSAGSGGVAHIYSGGELVESIDLAALSETHEFTVNAPSVAGNDTTGSVGYNVIEAEHGRIRVLDTNCAGGDCMRQGWISQGITPIVCLPHRLVIQIEGSTNVDAVVG